MKTKTTIILFFSFFTSILTVKSESIKTLPHDKLYTLSNNFSQESINETLLKLNASLLKTPQKTTNDPRKDHDEILNKIALEADIHFLNDLSNHLKNPTQESATKLKNWALTSSKYAEIVQAALKEHP